jgi:hypothetical protein
MASAHEIALEVLRSFGPNVVARRLPLTYGQYAASMGRDPAEYGLAIGQAMHAIGAICVLRQLPVAPLFWVRRSDSEPSKVFENDLYERHYILDSKDINTMYVVAREYEYSQEEFTDLETRLQKSLAFSGVATQWSPHKIWHETFKVKVKDSGLTYYERAMARYRTLFEQIKSKRVARK